MIDVTDDEVMSALASLSLERVTTDVAALADRLATEYENGQLPKMTAAEALRAFAATVRSTNAKVWPKGTAQ